jgi:hypothetical protein
VFGVNVLVSLLILIKFSGIIGSSYFVSRIDFVVFNFVCEGTQLNFAKTVKNLGVVFDQCFTWRPQVEALSRKALAAYRSLNFFRNF